MSFSANKQNLSSIVDFPKFFKNICFERRINKAELSRLSQVSESTLSRIEAGTQQPSINTLKKIAPYLQVSETELMEKAGYPVSKPESIPPRFATLFRTAGELSEEDQEEISNMMQSLIELKIARKRADK